MLSDIENKNMGKIEFRASWIDIYGKVKVNHIESKTDEDLKVI